MGKLIICRGKQTTKPYCFKITNTKIYSMEELCYYIYNNIDILNEEFFDFSLAKWIEDEMKLPVPALKLKDLIDKGSSLKYIVVCILCSTDYYTESEIKKLIITIDEYKSLNKAQKKKKSGDIYLKYKKYHEAAGVYLNLLDGKDNSLSPKEYGDIVHNLAIVYLNTVGVRAAAPKFKEAYEKNQNMESLKQYLFALKLSNQDNIYEDEIANYGISEDIKDKINIEYKEHLENAMNEINNSFANELLEYKQSGKLSNFYHMAGSMIDGLKQEYRLVNSPR